MFTKADHVGMSVKDMEKAIAFYRDVVGMEKVFDRSDPEFVEGVARIIGVEGAQVRVVHRNLNDSIIELFDYAYPKGREPRPDRQQSDYGLIHIGFIVEDFWGTYRHLLDHGVRFLADPVEIRPGVHVAYFHGVEYEVCEIREILPQTE
jgi:catechol 2,3-dioxygenase-like lactoylglutathione lyase family enzyme